MTWDRFWLPLTPQKSITKWHKAKLSDGTVLIGAPNSEYAMTNLPKDFIWYYITTAIQDGVTYKKDVISLKVTFSPEELLEQLQCKDSGRG